MSEEPFLLRPLHNFLLPYVTSSYSNDLISRFQKMCGIRRDGKIENHFLYHYFKFASFSGEEMFGITLPLLFWFAIDIAIPFLTHFGVMLTVGQIMKDLLRLPRPPARVLKVPLHDSINGDTALIDSMNGDRAFTPVVTLSPNNKICKKAVETNDDDKYLGVIKLENHFETEYGLPSTHTMSGMLPFVILLEIQRQMNLSRKEYIKYGFDIVKGDTSNGRINNVSSILETNYAIASNEINTYFYVFAMFYALSVALSRMYVGVHSPLDILTGAYTGVILVYFLHIHGTEVDQILYKEKSSICLILVSWIIFGFFYPKSRPWTASYGTSALIVGSWLGFAISLWYIYTIDTSILRILKDSQENVQSMFRHQFIHLTANKVNNTLQVPYPMTDYSQGVPLDSTKIRLMLLQVLIAVVLALLTKTCVKYCATKVFMFLFRNKYMIPHANEMMDARGRAVSPEKSYVVEVPVRTVTYISVAMACTILTPCVWRLLNLI
mmetsp:Transcript_19704/g.19038  ORF Transcript_19704/g.19038 Transcript_19704/m.19038 type:complete len:494 (-) Transcript_19704:256-1737(-)